MRIKCIDFTSGSEFVTEKWIQQHRFPTGREKFSRQMLLFAYLGDLLLSMRSFNHSYTSYLKSDVIVNSAQPFSYEHAVIYGARRHFRMCL